MTQTTNVWQNIAGALNSQLAAVAGIPSVNGIQQVAWPNVKFIPSSQSSVYVRPFLMPGQTVTASIGVDGTNRQVGVYRIDVVGVANAGTQDVMELADDIADTFVRGTVLSQNGIRVHISTNDITPHSNDQYFTVSVKCRWFSYGEL